MPRKFPTKDEVHDILDQDSDASDEETWETVAIYQQCGDVPEEDAMLVESDASSSSTPCTSPSSHAVSLSHFPDSSSDPMTSPPGFPGTMREKKIRHTFQKAKGPLEESDDDQDADDPPLTSSPSRGPPSMPLFPSAFPAVASTSEPISPLPMIVHSIWDTPVLPDDYQVPMSARVATNVNFSASVLPLGAGEKGTSPNMTLEAPVGSVTVAATTTSQVLPSRISMETSLSATLVSSVSASATPVPRVSATPVSRVSATPLSSVGGFDVSLDRGRHVSSDIASDVSSVSASATLVPRVSATPVPRVSATPLSSVGGFDVCLDRGRHVSSDSTSDVSSVSASTSPVPVLTPNELKSRKRARGPLCNLAGNPITNYHEGSVRTRDGNVWHRDPNPNLPVIASPHVVPPGSLTQVMNEKHRPEEFFATFIPDEQFAAMTVYTNDRIDVLKQKYKVSKATTDPTSITELKALIGILIMSGIKADNHVSTRQMWSSFDGCPLYRSTMSNSRFNFLIRALRFDNSRTRAARVAVDRLAPIRELWETFIDACRTCYVPGPHLTIDEQLVPFRGKVAFKMYIPSKPAK